eukprot:scaffold13_cov241-Pinguiococcus_pyrenoidosus.AAC.42
MVQRKQHGRGSAIERSARAKVLRKPWIARLTDLSESRHEADRSVDQNLDLVRSGVWSGLQELNGRVREHLGFVSHGRPVILLATQRRVHVSESRIQ